MHSKKDHSTIFHYIVIFPFLGMEYGKSSYKYLQRLIKICQEAGEDNTINIVYDQKSRGSDNRKILSELEEKKINIIKRYGVDTCQNWLSGWGYVFDNLIKSKNNNHRLVLIPGDLVDIKEEEKFFLNLKNFMLYDEKPLLIGDFEGSDPQGTKQLIDVYGVYPMTANFFPQVWEAIKRLKIRRTRSEFLNIEAETLRRLLKKRAFAYAQTLNLLINHWQYCMEKSNYNTIRANRYWVNSVERLYLGVIMDETKGRYYKGAIEQIERVERMLRTVWREVKQWDNKIGPDKFQALAGQYERLDTRSTKIREAARIAIWAQMD